MKALVFGEILWDVYTDAMYIGGAPFNFAAHFVKCGGNASLLTGVGKDELGEKTIKAIEEFGVDTQFVCKKYADTGRCLVTLDNDGVPSYNLVDGVAYDFIKKPDLKNQKYDVLYFGTLALRNQNNQNVIKQIITENNFNNIFVDINLRKPYYCEKNVVFALENATILKISDEELPEVMRFLGEDDFNADKSAAILSGRFKNIKLLIITKGDKGALCYECDKDKFHMCEAKKTDVVSSVGAGDSFSASFLSKYLKGYQINQCLDFATKISGYVVSQPGAIPEYTSKDFE